ncbi:MAG: type II secretion system protein [Akkermansiaceae bacterium]|nr:type II secretion system protein [Akkermansiaceae bacterium]
MTKTRGFTLVELLVVVAIILSLAGLLFSFTKRGIDAAQSARCVNNIKQLCQTQIAVSGDYGGYLVHASGTPYPIDRSNKANFALHFAGSLMPEAKGVRRKLNEAIKSVEMLSCPTAYNRRQSELLERTGHSSWRTYGLNARIGYVPSQTTEQGNNAHVDGATRFDQLEDPSLTILVSEPPYNEGNKVYRSAFGPGSARTSQVGMAKFHKKGFHVGYADSHVERHTDETFPSQNNVLPDGRQVRLRTGGSRTDRDEHFSIVWRGTRTRRSIPDP